MRGKKAREIRKKHNVKHVRLARIRVVTDELPPGLAGQRSLPRMAASIKTKLRGRG